MLACWTYVCNRYLRLDRTRVQFRLSQEEAAKRLSVRIERRLKFGAMNSGRGSTMELRWWCTAAVSLNNMLTNYISFCRPVAIIAPKYMFLKATAKPYLTFLHLNI